MDAEVEKVSTKKRLCETLNDLSSEELEKFKSLIELEKGFPVFSIRKLKMTNTRDIVELMVDTYSRQYLGLTKHVLKLMNRTDLVQRLIDTSTRTKEKHWPSLMQRVETLEFVIELLLETLKDLSKAELKMFKSTLSVKSMQQKAKYIPFDLLDKADMQGTVCLMVQYCGQQSVEMTKDILKKMKRTDLVQRLSDSSSRPKKQLSVDEHQSSLSKKVETMESVIELLLETLKDLSEAELERFKSTLCQVYQQGHSSVQSIRQNAKQIPLNLLDKADMQDTVCLMVQYCGQQSVEMTKESLKKMKRTDLVQRLPDSSSRPKKKLQSTQINKAATMGAVKELLLETLSDLSYEEQNNFTWFLQLTFFQRSVPQIHWSRLPEEDMTESLVDAMVEKHGQKSLEMIREVLMDMNRTDLVQRLSETSSGIKAAAGSSGEVFGVNTKEKEKHSVREDWPALIQKVESMESVIELLLETLKDLSDTDLKEFIGALLSQPEFHRHVLSIPLNLLQTAHVQDTVFLMVQICGQKCVKKTEDILKTMKRTDLVPRLSDRSSGFKKKNSADEHHSALIHKVATVAAVQQLLLETLNDLNNKELGKFKNILQLIVSKKYLPSISSMWGYRADRADIVNEMVHTYGQQSVELTREVLMDMKRTDLVQRLSKPSSGLKEKHRPSLMQRVETMDSVIELLLEALKDLTKAELEMFKSTLHPVQQQGPSSIQLMQQKAKYIPLTLLNIADMQGTVCLMVQYYGQQSVEMTKESLKRMKRTDLVQRLSDSSSRPKKELSVDEQWSSLIKKAATMGAVKELLLETLNDLSYEEQKNFKWFLQFTFFQSLPQIHWSRLLEEYMAESLADVMVEKCGQKSVEVTREVLIKMNQADLVQRLSETSSGLEAAAGSSAEVFGVNTTEKEKHSVEEDWPALIQKVETMESVIELLLEALKDLSEAELEMFKSTLRPVYKEGHSSFKLMQQKAKYIPFDLLDKADMQGTVCLMVQYCGQQSVEMTKESLKMIKRTSSSSEELSVEGFQSALIKKAATMGAVKELLLETLNDLSYEEQKNFALFLQFTLFQRSLPQIYWRKLQMKDMAESLVNLMVKEYGQKSLEVTREVLMDMNRTDLVQRLSETSSGPKAAESSAAARSLGEVFGVNTTEKEKHSVEEDWPELIQRLESMESVIELLLETLKDLSVAELEYFKDAMLSQPEVHRPFLCIPLKRLQTTHVQDTVFLMVQICGQNCVKMTEDILKMMKRTDLVQRLSDRSSGSKKKHSADEHRSALIHKVATVAAMQQLLLETLNDLSYKELGKFKNILQLIVSKKNLRKISLMESYRADRAEIVNQIVHTYSKQSFELTREVLMAMERTDLVQRLSKPSSGLKGPSRNQELEGCGSIMQDSSDWTKLKPEVNSTDADEAPTYSLQSEAGNFECSVSGLRWVCKEKVSFKYQFCSWEEPMERMERISYMPAGPLINITAIVGKLVEVYLPHWICIDDDPKILDKLAVLHIDDCGDVVEKVAEVTSSHVKLFEPVFSPRAVLMKAGFPVKISCDVLIYYQPNTPFLKLHVYLIPHDPALQQALDKKKFSKGFELIQKPRPNNYLKMQQGFKLAADMDTARIQPERMTLRYDSQDPNFYEVFIKKPDRDFHLRLSHIRKGEPQFEPVWTCEIRTDDYQSSAHLEAAESLTGPGCDATVKVKQTRLQSSIPGSGDNKHSVDEHLSELMQKGATITTDGERLLNVLAQLKQQEFKEFKWFLQDSDILTGLPHIPYHRLEKGDMLDVVDLMLHAYSQQSVELTKKVFQKIHRNDLVQKL
ncbi:uncharacterized protein LOC115568093 [Sparus aurata]|uniref:uncharacterized protein LOC115568093 n=1 Tax=Sparus aurata TaxID=8175 RepID=UPI0011C12879|nr:uncharacterized protein LOC115568093 [Sparus aurata]